MCINIQTKKNPKYQNSPLQPYMISYPCGKCPLCLRKRLSNWIFRIEQETKRSHSTSFITLTYDENNIPFTQYQAKRDIQLFIKRIRKNTQSFNEKYGYTVRYICVSEHGTKSTQRIHYHIIAFNFPNQKTTQAIWNKGFVTQSPLTPLRIKYTFKYLSKDRGNSRSAQPRFDMLANTPTYTPLLPPKIKDFQLQSQGIGSNYLKATTIEYHNRTIENCYITKPDGHTMSIPKYYKTKLYSEEKQLEVTNYQQQRIDLIQSQQIANLMYKFNISENEAQKKYELSKLNSTFTPIKMTKL